MEKVTLLSEAELLAVQDDGNSLLTEHGHVMQAIDYEQYVRLVTIARWANEAHADLNGWQWDGCLTGDCPHDTRAECDHAQAKSYADLCEVVGKLLDQVVAPADAGEGSAR